MGAGSAVFHHYRHEELLVLLLSWSWSLLGVVVMVLESGYLIGVLESRDVVLRARG